MKVRRFAQKGTMLLAAAALVVSQQNCAPYSANQGLADLASFSPDFSVNDDVANVTMQALKSCTSGAAPAFPDALGYGRNATGGRGGRVVFVTNTNDSGPGSLRQAVEVETGRRIVVFKVGGVLTAKKQIEVRGGNVTIAGQTAPGNGFAMIGARLRVVSNNVIVRGMKIRPGDGPGDTPRNRDALSVGINGSVTDTVIIDHNSLTWAIDETLTAWYTSKNITFSNNIIGEPLYDSIHVDEPKKGEPPPPPKPHGMGTLIGDDVDRITVIRNLYSSANGRNPLIRSTSGEVINNYIYNYGNLGTGIAGAAPTTVHVLNNYYQEGADTGNTRFPIDVDGSPGFDTYIDGNLSSKYRPSLSISESKLLSGSGKASYSTKPVFASSQAPIMPASDVRAHVAANVGARWPVLDSADARIIDQSLKGTGRRIDKVSQVGGMPSYPKGTAPVDSDDDGIPDSVEKVIGSNPFVKDDSGDVDGDGFTNIEEYINGLISGMDPNSCSSSTSPTPTPAPTRVPASIPAPAPSATPAPSSSALRVEAESFQLSGFEAVADASASNGHWIETKTTGSATMQFLGDSGTYDLRLAYYDENDGAASMSIKVGDRVVSSFSFDQNLGSPLANSMTKTSRVVSGVALQKGDLITLLGANDASEPVRTDYLEITPVKVVSLPPAPVASLVTIEAETMVLSGGFKVGLSGVASGGKWIQSSGPASAKIAFPGVAASYDVGVTYFDENDGISTMSFKVNGQVLKTWKWSKSLGSALASSATQTSMVIPGVALKKGDVIELSGTGTSGEPMRTDFIEFDPIK